MRPKLLTQLAKANHELWLVLSMFIILALINFVISSDRLLLGLYTLPTVFSAYYYGRRRATMTALAAVSLVILVAMVNPADFWLAYLHSRHGRALVRNRPVGRHAGGYRLRDGGALRGRQSEPG